MSTFNKMDTKLNEIIRVMETHNYHSILKYKDLVFVLWMNYTSKFKDTLRVDRLLQLIHDFIKIVENDPSFDKSNLLSQLDSVIILWNHFLKRRFDSQKEDDLKKELAKLDQEIEDLKFDHDIDDDQKKEIKDLYTYWKSTLDRKIILEDIKDNARIEVKADGRLFINELFANITLNNKSTLHLSDCNRIVLHLKTKINHLTIENCNYVNVRMKGGCISGMDCIRCQNVGFIFEVGNIYFIDVSLSSKCTYYIPKDIALETIVSTLDSMDLMFCTLDDDKRSIIDKFEKNKSFFDYFKQYEFVKENDKIQMHAFNIFDRLSSNKN